MDGSQTALLVYNFTAQPARVAVDLQGTGIRLAQMPKNLLDGGAAAPIEGPHHEIDLGAYGFAFLEVETRN